MFDHQQIVLQIEEQIESGAKVDYESGDLENKDGKRINDLEKKIQKLDSNTRLRVEKARQTAIEKAEDPAIMKTDLTLLLDVTIMLSFAAFGGFAMKIVGLPVAFGYIIGGLVVGPSTLSFVSNISQVQTLAQFGSMFKHAFSIRCMGNLIGQWTLLIHMNKYSIASHTLPVREITLLHI